MCTMYDMLVCSRLITGPLVIKHKGIKNAKRDGTWNMYTDHLINGSKHLHVHLGLLYISMLSHAFSPIVLPIVLSYY